MSIRLVLLILFLALTTVAAGAARRTSAHAARSEQGSAAGPRRTLASTSLPEAVVATWVLLAPTSESGDLPASRCDHAFAALGGLSQRPNAAVPFPNGRVPDDDAWADRVWLFSGWESDTEYTDSWLLDVSQSPPVWTQMSEVNSSSVVARWGTPVAFVPNGLHSSDTGLTAVLFSGIDNDGYVPQVSTFNFASARWRELVPLDATDSDQPFPRAFTEWFPMPAGYGSGAINSSTDAGTFFLIGGMGASDGVQYSSTDHDWADQWIFNLSSLAFERFGDYVCTENSTTCTDATTMSAYLSTLSSLADVNETELDLSSSIRPADIFPDMTRILAGWALSNVSATSLANAPGACTTECITLELANSSSTGSFRPSGIEGTRGVVVGTKMYEFGGYMCTEAGVQALGGDSCYLGSMWILDFETMEWTEIAPPTSDSDDAIYSDYWPSKRAYNTIAYNEARQLIIVQGGAYQDSASVFYFYDDTYAFSIALGQFVPLTVSGVLPPLSWSAGAAMIGDDLYHFGGCAGSTYYNSLYVLRIGLAIEASNCYAAGAGLTKATAGETASFTIQTRESSYVTNTTLNSTELVWGANATYGTGLALTAQVVVTLDSEATLVQATVTELGDGLYTVAYTLEVATSCKLYVYLSDDEIPGSPFTVTLEPSATASASRTTATGLGTSLTAKGKTATSLVQLVDEYGNSFVDTSAWSSTDEAGLFVNGNSSILLSARLGQSAEELDAVSGTFTNNLNGSFTLRYYVPSTYDSYVIAITLDNESVLDSPFTVTALDAIGLSSSVVGAFSALAALAILVCIAASAFVHRHRAESMMRASSPNFLHLLILGSALSSLSVVFLLVESDRACQALHSLLSIGLVTSMTALLAKSYRVERIFNARILKVQSSLTDRRLMIPTCAIIAGMIVINMMWIGINPLRATLQPSHSAADAAVLSFRSCSGGNSTAWVSAVIAYCGALLLPGVYLAVRTGHVPEAFNESKLIAATIYNLTLFSIIVVPLSFLFGSSDQFLLARVIIQAMSILWVSVFNVVALLTPKVRELSVKSRAGPGDPNLQSTCPDGVKSGAVGGTAPLPGTYSTHPAATGWHRGASAATKRLTSRGVETSQFSSANGRMSGGVIGLDVGEQSILAEPAAIELTQTIARIGRPAHGSPPPSAVTPPPPSAHDREPPRTSAVAPLPPLNRGQSLPVASRTSQLPSPSVSPADGNVQPTVGEEQSPPTIAAGSPSSGMRPILLANISLSPAAASLSGDAPFQFRRMSSDDSLVAGRRTRRIKIHHGLTLGSSTRQMEQGEAGTEQQA